MNKDGILKTSQVLYRKTFLNNATIVKALLQKAFFSYNSPKLGMDVASQVG